MANINRGDAQWSAQNYFNAQVNASNYQGGAPIGSNENRGYVRNDMLDWYEYWPGVSYISNWLGGSVSRSQLISAARQLANHYARVVRGIYGLVGTTTNGAYTGWEVPWSAYNIFFVQSGYHSAHWNSVVNAINADAAAEVAGNIEQVDLNNYFYRLFTIVNNNKNAAEVDLRICHSSCHSNCHGSRGRR